MQSQESLNSPAIIVMQAVDPHPSPAFWFMSQYVEAESYVVMYSVNSTSCLKGGGVFDFAVSTTTQNYHFFNVAPKSVSE